MSSAASEAFQRGYDAMQEGDITSAMSWLEQAHSLAQGDGRIALTLAAVWLRAGQKNAGRLFGELAQTHDLREAWVGLAASFLRRVKLRDAARAMAQALSRHALPANWDTAGLSEMAYATRAPGWCGMSGDGRLAFCLGTVSATPFNIAVTLDGQMLQPQQIECGTKTPMTLALPTSWGRGQILTVLKDRKHLLGSPIKVADISRIEGFVAENDGGLEGWAWAPHDPDHDAELSIEAVNGRGNPPLTITAADDTIRVKHPTILARPRGFYVPSQALARFDGPVRVRGRDGQDLYGSPIHPSAARRSAATAVANLALLLPPGPRSAPEKELKPVFLPSIPVSITSPPARGSARMRLVDVVVPVYRGKRETLACLNSLFASSNRWSRIVVVDDYSPDRELRQALNELEAQGRINLLRHKENRGFPAAANTGMQYGLDRDIVLLNSDILVPKEWLRRLRDIAYAAPDIGSVTPLSNDATILSYPDTENPNPIPDLGETQRLDELAQQSNEGVIVDIPTGVGFCMYIRRECLETVGALREDVFAQGYGEQIDFCLRARHAGWRHVAAPGVFVGHMGAQSFGAGKFYLLERNMKALNTLHPGYSEMMDTFRRNDPMAEPRRRLDMVRWRGMQTSSGSVLLITHAKSGGVQTHIAARAKALGQNGFRPIILRPVPNRISGQDCVLSNGPEGVTPNLRFKLPEELDLLARFLKPDRPLRAEVHNLVGHDHCLLELIPRLAVPYDMFIHDYASFCPRIALITGTRRYCGEPSLSECEACIADNGSETGEDIPVRTGLIRSKRELENAEQVVVPSNDVASRLRHHFPTVHPMVVAWESEPARRVLKRRPSDLPAMICLAGAIGIEKGYDALLGCARNAAARNLALQFVVVGFSIDDSRLLATGRVRILGRYQEADAASLIRAQKADIGFFSSICPETWSYTLTQLWQGGLNVAAFDIGTPAERIRRVGRGWLMPLGLEFGAVNDTLIRLVRSVRSQGCLQATKLQ